MKPSVHSMHVQKKRRRAKRLHWTMKNRYRRAVVRQMFHLPTRTTLTYAEAQRFVDVYINGSVSRLNVMEPLCVIDECDVRKYNNPTDCGSEQLPADNNPEVVMSGLCRQTVVNSQQVCKSSAATVMSSQPAAYYRHVEKTPEELNEEVEYDIDEQVFSFLLSLRHVCFCVTAVAIDCRLTASHVTIYKF